MGEKRGDTMKQYQYKEYGGKRDYNGRYGGKKKKKIDTYHKKTITPWRNYQKSIRST